MVISRGDHVTTAALGSKARFQPNRDTHSESNYQHRGCKLKLANRKQHENLPIIYKYAVAPKIVVSWRKAKEG